MNTNFFREKIFTVSSQLRKNSAQEPFSSSSFVALQICWPLPSTCFKSSPFAHQVAISLRTILTLLGVSSRFENVCKTLLKENQSTPKHIKKFKRCLFNPELDSQMPRYKKTVSLKITVCKATRIFQN